MPAFATLRPNLYKDSVALMRIAQSVLAQPGVSGCTLLMGTPANRAILADAGLDRPELAKARPSDLMIVVEADDDEAVARAREAIEQRLQGDEGARVQASDAARPVRAITLAHAHDPQAALVQISVPGPYAAAEAMKALRRGLHVFLFSDNVPLEQERAIKALARDKGLLVMGPDCGTAIVDGVPIGFANVVRKGGIGLVGASGTGLQEVSCRIHALGQGVRHALGTGGRDVSAEVGGISMCRAIDLLAADAATQAIVIVSKPPAPKVASDVLARLRACDKPAVVLFLGADLGAERLPDRIVAVGTLDDAARAAVALLDRSQRRTADDEPLERAAAEAGRLAPGQRYVRGLYSGGTFCTEAQLLWRARGMRVQSNAPVDAAAALQEGERREHVALDLGADEFTVGRPHPMIDPAARVARVLAEARDPATAALVLDVVLGYGAHDDPAGALAPAIEQARAHCAQAGRHLPVVTFVCGTEDDPQSLSAQQAKLVAAGAIVLPGSTAAARFAAAIAQRAAAGSTQAAPQHAMP